MRASALALALPLLVGATPAPAEVPASWAREWPTTDFSRTIVDLGEIRGGGPPKDGIPSIDAPRFVAVGEIAGDLEPGEPVMSVVLGDDARAYPLRILMWHEIVNDTVNGVPIAVTYCPLCNSGVVFERTVAGTPTTFGTTGKLRHSDLVMYDRASESWWQQFDGRAIVGERVGTELERLPARLEAFAEFADRHPRGAVLVPTDARARDYGRNPYVGYDSAPRPFLFDGSYDGPGSPLMRVVAVEGLDRAYSLELVRAAGAVVDEPFVIRWRPGQRSALDTARIAEGRDVGTVTVQRQRADGTLEDVVYDVPFAFALRAFRPELPIHHAD